MIKMLLFIMALEPLMLVSWLSIVYLSSGHFTEGLPFAAISIMCAGCFFKGFIETVDLFRSGKK